MGSNSTLAVETSGLVKTFGETRAVDGVDLAVPTGTVYGLLGPNGAGKTTRPDAGDAAAPDGGHGPGVRPRRGARGRRGAARVSVTGQYASVDEDLTGRENLVLLGRLLGHRGPRRGSGPTSCSTRSVWPRRRTGRSRTTRVACGAGSTSPPASSSPPTCSSSTSRPPASTRAAATRCGTSSAPGRRGHDRAAHDAVPRRGRPARRPDRGHRPRQGHRRGHPGGAEVPGRRRRAPAAAPGSRPARAGGGDALGGTRLPVQLGRRLRSPDGPGRRGRRRPDAQSRRPGRTASWPAPGSPSTTSRWGQPSLDEVFLALTGHPACGRRARGRAAKDAAEETTPRRP